MYHYEHSGAVPILGLLLTLSAAVLLMPVGVVYTYLIVWIPLVYVNFFVSVGFGAVLGLAIGFAARLGKIRNTLVVGVLGVAAAVPAYYAAWMVDPLARLGLQNGVILMDPEATYAWMRWLFNNGSWGIRGIDPVKGYLLLGVWLVEAGAIFSLSAMCAAFMVGDQSFCETCRRWTRKHGDLNKLSVIDADPGALERCVDGQFDGLCQLPIADESEEQFVRFDLATCPTCGECNVLTVQMVRTETDKKGNTTTNAVPLVKNLLISEAEVALIRGAGRPRAAGGSEPTGRPPEAPDDAT